MPSRRAFLKMVSPAIVAPALAISAAAEIDRDECEYFAGCLAEAMRKKHGGTPVITINHKIALAQVIVT